MMTMNPVVGAMFAAFDSVWVFVAIGIGSAIYNWLQKRNAAGNDQESQPPSGPPQRRQAPTRTQQPAPRQTKSVSWEDELRRLLEGDAPVAPPPPPPVFVVEKPRPAPPPQPPVRVRPFIEQPSPAPAGPLVTITESSSASQRVEQLNRKVETYLGHVATMAETTFAFQKASGLDVAVADRMSRITGQHVAQAAVVKHKTDSPEVAQVVALFRNPRTARQALIASFIIGPPRALEEQPTGF